ncbi:MAG: hypothetical protein A3F31_02555 [Candidatus Levybacteria bacterium RIFCSPHIGHO2_12_FULL_38_12]|nr:MAG: hypothetical protein A3D75_02170 [Candidatus Levybacteria bacterium RIFCSPHIGHO2_02_FULL_37_18]OGH22387.1 MAG: hypothetical protein A3F31_02555 [Candidatus Levybacteria bacterium RIFCSPHIGHO2_12_FULL_38_12]OGH33631.1 MAG: hypothetical protein A3A47_02260 [Candidatus Levybacteria bacterium RIFCSPLOWO2_01_FULL_37_20]OGH44312.1 MAG: hypothetical protein A3J14_03860 [Candidatus Levybacteria bacterium RIFCSPLOWO2_02_FULL_37_18]OGH51151.1 MAG: hypothetical protein A3G13_02330 [Candidatus Levy
MSEEQQFSTTTKKSIPWKIILFILVLILLIGSIGFFFKNKKSTHVKTVSIPNQVKNSLTPTVIQYNCHFEQALCAKPPCPTIEVCSASQ